MIRRAHPEGGVQRRRASDKGKSAAWLPIEHAHKSAWRSKSGGECRAHRHRRSVDAHFRMVDARRQVEVAECEEKKHHRSQAGARREPVDGGGAEGNAEAISKSRK